MIALILAALAGPATVTVAPGQGLKVASEDGRFAIGLRARFQLRQSLYAGAPADGKRQVTLQTQLYTARVWVDGHVLSEETRYVLQLAVGPRDYRDGATSPVYDAYLDFSQNPNLSVRVGQFFVPFDRLRTVREFSLQLPDRPRVVGELTLDRDVGVVAYSNRFGGEGSPVAWRLGLFGGQGIHALGPREPGALGVARLELRPLGPVDDDSEGDLQRREDPGLALGLGVAGNLRTPRVRSTTAAFFEGGTANYLHLVADGVFKWRGFATEAEVVTRMASEDQLVSTGPDGAERLEWTRSGWGLVVQPSLMLTDHLEVAGRYGRLGAFEGTDPTYVADVEARANEVALGASVYLNGHRMKVQTGVAAFFGDDDPLGARADAHVLVDVMF